MRTPVLVAALVLAAPALAHARGFYDFGDLIAEISMPAGIQPGQPLPIVARIDQEAYCARSTALDVHNCRWIQPLLHEHITLATAPDAQPGGGGIQGTLTRGDDGIYRGTLNTLPCQRAGEYLVKSREPNPALANVRTRVASTPRCEADREAPRVTSVKLPQRVRVPNPLPSDLEGYGRGRLIIEVEDDVTGPLRVSFERTPANDPGWGYNGGELGCEPCQGRWICSGDVPLCGKEEDVAIRVVWVDDGAGRHREFWPVDGDEPFAVVHCGADESPPPVVNCEPPASIDAGASNDASAPAPPTTPREVAADDAPAGACAFGREAGPGGIAWIGFVALVLRRRRIVRRDAASRAPVLTTAFVLILPAVAQAKGADFGDLIAEISMPASIEPGQPLTVAARIDVPAYCARTKVYKSSDCLAAVKPQLQEHIMLVVTPNDDLVSPRRNDISGTVTRDADGIYRGALTTLPCQKAGEYAVRSFEPNPALANARVRVASTPGCAADREPPRVTSVKLPERVRLPSPPPRDVDGFARGRLIVEVEDDVTGPLEIMFERTPANAPDTSFGGGSLATCEPCGTRWICSGDVPLCGRDVEDIAIRIRHLYDRAGRYHDFWPLGATTPFAIVHCGADDSPSPVVMCAKSPSHDAGAPDAGSMEASSSQPSPMAPIPSDEPTGGASDSGVASTNDPPAPASCAFGRGTGAAAIAWVGLAALVLRRRRRS